MANTTTTPNMTLNLPVVGVDPGPDWANNVNAALSKVDSHNHTNGQGVPITPAAINVNADLSMNQNNLTNTNTVMFYPVPAAPSSALYNASVYVYGSDLYYRDGAGNNVRITNGGNVTGSPGTITGLPYGTASANYQSTNGTFQFQSATNTPAALSSGPVSIGTQTTSPNQITLQSPNSLAAAYALTLPAGLPASSSNVVKIDNAGNLSATATTGSGNAVLATNPTISGATLSSPSMTNASISNATLSSPSMTNATTNQITIGPSGTAFKMQTFTGTLSPYTGQIILSYGSYSTIYGIIGFTTESGVTAHWFTIPTAIVPSGSTGWTNCCTVSWIDTSGYGVYVYNNQSSILNSYKITVFYI